MKDVLNGISALNPLGHEQRLLPMPTDLISNRNADEIDEIDGASQGVNNTRDKSHVSLSGQNVKSTRKSILYHEKMLNAKRPNLVHYILKTFKI
jgi:hypothetical protein